MHEGKLDEMREFHHHNYTHSNIEDPSGKTYSDQIFEQYKLLADYNPENDIPDDDLLPHDTRVTQSLSSTKDNSHPSSPDRQSEFPEITSLEDDDPLPDIPVADVIQPESPADPLLSISEEFHGTDLLNGFGAEEEPPAAKEYRTES